MIGPDSSFASKGPGRDLEASKTKEISPESFREYLGNFKLYELLCCEVEKVREEYLKYAYGQINPDEKKSEDLRRRWYETRNRAAEILRRLDRMRAENPNLYFIDRYLNVGREVVALDREIADLSQELRAFTERRRQETGIDEEIRQDERYRELAWEIEERSSERKFLSEELDSIRRGLPDFVVEQMEGEIRGSTITEDEFREYLSYKEINNTDGLLAMRDKNPDLIYLERYQELLEEYRRISDESASARDKYFDLEKKYGRDNPQTQEAFEQWDRAFKRGLSIGEKLVDLKSRLPDFVIKELERRTGVA